VSEEDKPSRLSKALELRGKMIVALLALAGVGGAGSMIGLTIEPSYVTELRVENARLTERVDNIELLLEDCQMVVKAYQASLREKEEE